VHLPCPMESVPLNNQPRCANAHNAQSSMQIGAIRTKDFFERALRPLLSFPPRVRDRVIGGRTRYEIGGGRMSY